MSRKPSDLFTLEIIQNSLQAVADEMFVAMGKTAMSSIIYEVLDMGTGVMNKDGELASSGAGIPAFVGVLDKSVRVLIEKFDSPGDIEPGDIFATNDPYCGGVTHLNDIVVAMPVFYENRIIAWTANIAHNSDIGGLAPGSLSEEATEIFHEGLRLPAIKLVSRGEMIRPVMEIMKGNSRMPDVLEGDVWAAIAAARVGSRRLLEIARKYGGETFEQAMDGTMDYGEQTSLKGLSELPRGRFELSEEQDDGRNFNVKIEITRDRFTVDLRDNPEQGATPLAISRDGAMVVVQMLFKSLTDKETPANAGSFRPIRLLTEEGSVFHAREPGPLGYYYEVELRLYDLIWRCLAPYMPHLLGAGHFASVCGTFVGGIHPDTGRHYTIIEPQLGGWGASETSDGTTAMFCGFHGETFNCPAEVNEARNGLFVDRMEINTAPGGEGRFNGGRGIVIDYRVRSESGFFTVAYTRSRFPPWGANGGNDGSPNYVEFRPKGGQPEAIAFASNRPTKAGDVIRIHTGIGGGSGKPRERCRDAVRADIRNGYITRTRAEMVYGPL